MQVHGKTNISHLKGHFAMQPQNSGFDRESKLVTDKQNTKSLPVPQKFFPTG